MLWEKDDHDDDEDVSKGGIDIKLSISANNTRPCFNIFHDTLAQTPQGKFPSALGWIFLNIIISYFKYILTVIANSTGVHMTGQAPNCCSLIPKQTNWHFLFVSRWSRLCARHLPQFCLLLCLPDRCPRVPGLLPPRRLLGQRRDQGESQQGEAWQSAALGGDPPHVQDLLRAQHLPPWNRPRSLLCSPPGSGEKKNHLQISNNNFSLFFFLNKFPS